MGDNVLFRAVRFKAARWLATQVDDWAPTGRIAWCKTRPLLRLTYIVRKRNIMMYHKRFFVRLMANSWAWSQFHLIFLLVFLSGITNLASLVFRLI